MATEASEVGGASTSTAVASSVVDADAHVYTPNGIADVLPNMPQAWRKRFEMKGLGSASGSLFISPLTPRFAHPANTIVRTDARPPGGGLPDAAWAAEHYLDAHNVEATILNALEVGALAVATAGPDESLALCSAYNDYFIEHWCDADPRFRYAICVSPQDPVAAADEIRRLGSHGSVAAVYLPLGNILVGNRYYDPIYAAAVEHDLPILLHVTGAECIFQGGPLPSSGFPETFAERRAGFIQYGIANISSLAFSQVFSKFPAIRFAFAEFGFSWLLPILWRLDSTWQACRLEVPWITKRPSELLFDHVRLATQPVEDPDDGAVFDQFLSMLGTEWLMFSTDYPHWDGDEPATVFRSVKDDARQALFRDTASWMYRLS